MSRARKHQRGAALILVLLALILLTAIGLAMMFSADTETSIAANYRDKQIAMYAAQAGLQEVRDRLNRSKATEPYYIPPPAGLPSANAKNVIYILNPAPGETVDPWDPNSPYFDTSLCAAVPAGLCSGGKPPTSGYTAYNNSNSTKPDGTAINPNPYHVVTAATYTPLPYKWVRITLKADNSTPVHVNGSNAGKQVCWDPTHGAQVLLPAGYNADCTSPGGTVTSVAIAGGNDGGSGYDPSNPPNVQFSGGGGSGAAAVPIIAAVPTDHVSVINVTANGSNYDVAPTVTLSAPPAGGTQATAVATIVPMGGGQVNSITLNTPVTGCYQTNTPPTVTISGGGGSGAVASAVMTAGQSCVYSWTASGSCKDQGGNTVSVSGAGGFTGTISFHNGNGNVTGTSVTNGGSGITNPGTLSGIGGCSVTNISYTPGYQVASINKTSGGSGYNPSSPPTITIGSPGIGAPPTATATVSGNSPNAGEVISITVTNPGSGYITPPTVTFTTPAGHTGSGATATAQLGSSGKITGFTVTNPGTGYTSAPTVKLTGGTGSGALAVATVDNGDYKGTIFLVTAFARAKGGSIAFSEMELANLWLVSSSQPQKIPGALTLAGPYPSFDPPNSMNMVINGTDKNSCGEANKGPKPALGVYDDPNNPPKPGQLTAVQSVTQAISTSGAKPDNYVGINNTKDVWNVYDQVGDPSSAVSGLEAEVEGIIALLDANNLSGNHILGDSNGTCSNTLVSVNNCIPLGKPPANPSDPASKPTDAITVVDGNASIGPVTGYGILVVRGDLTMSGNTGWNGVILAVGNGKITWNGGGNSQITGAVYIANVHGASGTLATPDADWNGGGGNGIQYDHCRADNLLANLPKIVKPSPLPLKVLSVRSLGNQ